jgi:hypothetical protein
VAIFAYALQLNRYFIVICEILLRKSFLGFLISIACSSILNGQEIKQSSDTVIVKIIFAGDVMGHMPQIEAAYDSLSNSCKFDTTFYYLRPFLKAADLQLQIWKLRFPDRHIRDIRISAVRMPMLRL